MDRETEWLTYAPMNNKRGVEFALSWIVGIAIALIALVVLLVFWNLIYNAIGGLPG